MRWRFGAASLTSRLATPLFDKDDISRMRGWVVFLKETDARQVTQLPTFPSKLSTLNLLNTIENVLEFAFLLILDRFEKTVDFPDGMG